MKAAQRTTDRGSFYFRILTSYTFASFFGKESSFLDDVSLHHWARKTYSNKCKQLLKSSKRYFNKVCKSFDYFNSPIASRLRSKMLIS